MGSKNATLAEKEQLEEIKEMHEPTKAELDAVKGLDFDHTAKLVTSLRQRVKAMVLKLDEDVKSTSEKIGTKFYQLDADGDGIISADKRKLEAGELEAIIKTFDVTKDGRIDLEDVHEIA